MSDALEIRVDIKQDAGLKLVARSFSKARMRQINKQINTSTRDWLIKRANENLTEAVRKHGRSQRYNRRGTSNTPATKPLRDTISLHQSHAVTDEHLDFMIAEKVFPRAPFYQILEEGSNIFIGNQAPIAFRSGNRIRRPVQGSDPVDATLRGGGKLTIKRGIKGYHYLADTIDQFFDSGECERILQAKLADLQRENPGVKIEIKPVQRQGSART